MLQSDGFQGFSSRNAQSDQKKPAPQTMNDGTLKSQENAPNSERATLNNDDQVIKQEILSSGQQDQLDAIPELDLDANSIEY